MFNSSFSISEEGESGVGDSEEAGEALQGDGGRGEGHEGVGVREPEEPGREDEQGGADHVGEGAQQEAVQRARAQDGGDARGHQVKECNVGYWETRSSPHLLDHTVCLLMNLVSPKIGLKRNSFTNLSKPTHEEVARMFLYHFRFRPF